MNIVPLSPSIALPVTAERSWRHLRVSAGDPLVAPDDADDIAIKLGAAVKATENFTGLALSLRNSMGLLDAFPSGEITIPVAPITAITSIVYVDTEGVEQTMDESDYQFDPYSKPPRLLTQDGAAWPSTKNVINAVRITFECGHSAAGDSPPGNPIPEPLVAAILLTLGHLYENREDSTPGQVVELPYGAKFLAQPYRIYNGFA